MCLIVDANRASSVFGSSLPLASAPIWAWLKRDGALVYGGLLRAEIEKLRRARKTLVELKRAGRAYLVDGQDLEQETRQLLSSRSCTSDDPHVIALARVSGARVLCSDDQKAIDDFKNPKLVSRPRGAVYRNATHAHLLGHSKACPKNQRRRTKK